jgi:hypothetical protein
MQKHLENLQNSSVEWRSQLVKMQEDFTDLATDNHLSFLELQVTRAALQGPP